MELDKPYNHIIQKYQDLFEYINKQPQPEKWNKDKMFWISKLIDTLEEFKKHDITIDEALQYLYDATSRDSQRFINKQRY